MEDIQGVAFDLFDTLIMVRNLSLDEAIGRVIHSLQVQGLTIEAEHFTLVYRQTSRQFIEQARRDGRESHNRFWISNTLSRLGHDVQPDDCRIAQAVEAYFSAFLEFSEALPKTRDMLTVLQSKFRLGLVSNFTHGPAARDILERHGLSVFFDVIVISGEFGYRKPHSRIFDELGYQLGISNTKIAYVGDDVENDVTGAHQAGMRPIFTQYAKQFKGMSTQTPLEHAEIVKRLSVPTITNWEDLQTLLCIV
ncbi:MAG: HAD family hydrolase [bacterium]|nr:HAD family hydrolase [bacterium]